MSMQLWLLGSPVREDDDAAFKLPATPVARQKRQKRVPVRFRRSLTTSVVSTKDMYTMR